MSAVLDEAALEHMAELESEITSYIDDLASITIELAAIKIELAAMTIRARTAEAERDAGRIEIIRIKATGECI